MEFHADIEQMVADLAVRYGASLEVTRHDDDGAPRYNGSFYPAYYQYTAILPPQFVWAWNGSRRLVTTALVDNAHEPVRLPSWYASQEEGLPGLLYMMLDGVMLTTEVAA